MASHFHSSEKCGTGKHGKLYLLQVRRRRRSTSGSRLRFYKLLKCSPRGWPETQAAAFNAIEHLAAAAATLHLNFSFALILEDDATGGGAALKCLWNSVNAMATARNDTGFVQLTTWDGTLR
jgi:hypothetical protein